MDLSFLEKFTKGDQKKMKRYISLYLNEAPKTFAEMERNMNAKDWEQLRINAHSLKPQADFMGLPELKEMLVQIENSVKDNQLEKINQLFIEAKSIHLQSVQLLTGALEKQ